MASEILKSSGEGAPQGLLVTEEVALKLKHESRTWLSWDLTPRQVCDVELLMNGAFHPLRGFLNRTDYERVCREMRLADGTLWPIPVALDVSATFGERVKPGMSIALRDPEGVMLAVLTVEDRWTPDRRLEAESVFGTLDKEHPGVRHLLDEVGPVYLGGKISGLQLPQHHDFQSLRQTPQQVRGQFARRGWNRVIAFQTRKLMHRAHFEMTLRAARERDAGLLIHPVVGMTQPGDVDHFCRVRCYQALLPRYPGEMAMLSLLPLSMRLTGPREALWHAMVQRNFGCTHFIIGRDHAAPECDRAGKSFHPPFAAQELALRHQTELGIEIVPVDEMESTPASASFASSRPMPSSAKMPGFSDDELRTRLTTGHEIPEWFTFPEVAAELRKTYPPRARQGFTVFFTGLSGSGKSTLARVLLNKLLELGGRPVTLLDGDIVRKNLSSELGFSREHRNLNILRIGFVANEITRNRGVAICAPIAPYDQIRKQVRQLIASCGGFILVHLSTALDVCEQRDRKGLYAKARAGLIPEFTGISDPYEAPDDAEVVLDTANLSVEDACRLILRYLEKEGYLTLPDSGSEPALEPPGR